MIYKVKVTEDDTKLLKAIIVPEGNREAVKDNIRKGSSTAKLDDIRLLLTVATIIGICLAMVDIKGA